MIEDGVLVEPAARAQTAASGAGQTVYTILRIASIAATGTAVGWFVGLLVGLFTGLIEFRC